MTYEYVCTACQHEWEAQQPISEAPLKVCPHCHQETARRQISGGAGFILKGGGWYADGYGSAKSASSTSESKTESKTKADTKPDAKADTKADAKPESKPETKSSKPSSNEAA
jgi:putative FmdB family regulatory protein